MNPYIAKDEWAERSSHWSVWLHCGKQRMHTYYSMGSAHTAAPKLCDVLYSLASDAASFPLDWHTGDALITLDPSAIEELQRALNLAARGG